MNSGFEDRPSLVVSVVSHGHGAMVQSLLQDIAKLSAGVVSRIVLTINIAEETSFLHENDWPFALDLRFNKNPLGFGKNHNAALLNASEDFFCILNPDVRLQRADPFSKLVWTAANSDGACAYPLQVDESGEVQDSERALVTPMALLQRRVLRKKEMRVDWVNAACLVFPRKLWESIQGFDESYHMYCEDVDLCLRIQLAGFHLKKAPCTLVHSGSRASHVKINHMIWHVKSLFHLWFSPVYKSYKKLAY